MSMSYLERMDIPIEHGVQTLVFRMVVETYCQQRVKQL